MPLPSKEADNQGKSDQVRSRRQAEARAREIPRRVLPAPKGPAEDRDDEYQRSHCEYGVCAVPVVARISFGLQGQMAISRSGIAKWRKKVRTASYSHF